MKTLIWKELREHVRWIPFGLLPMLYVIYQSVSAAAPVFDPERQLASTVIMIASIFACLLGALQSWPDNRPAARALLLHRGVTAETAFSAKLVVALLVFTVSILLPLLGLAIWIAIDARHTIAGYAIDVLPSAFAAMISFVAWPAAFLVVHRKASFFGSRLLPVAAAGFVLFVCMTWPTVSSRMALILLATFLTLAALLLLLAARAVFITDAVQNGFPRFAIWLLNSGSLLVAYIAVSVVAMLALQPDPATDHDMHREFVLGPDGDAWLQSTDSWDLKSVEVAKLIPDEPAKSRLQPAADWKPLLSWQTMGKQELMNQLFPEFKPIGSLVLNAPVQRLWLFDSRSQEILTYDVSMSGKKHVERRARLNVGNAELGELAPGLWDFGIGQNQGRVSIGHVKPGAIFPTEKGLFYLPIDGQSIRQIYKASATRPVISGQFGPIFGTNSMDIALRMADRIVLIWNGDFVAQTPNTTELGEFGDYGMVHALEILLPAEIETSETVRVGLHPTAAGEFVAVASKIDYDTYEQSQHWYRFDSTGKILDQQTFAEVLYTHGETHDGAIAAIIPPGIFGFVVCLDSLTSNPPTVVPAVINTIRNEPIEAVSFVLLLAVQSFIAVLLAVWTVRRRNVSQAIRKRWYIAAALFGPLAALGILTVYPKISMERCGGCHALTPVTSSKCEHCHESLDEVTRTGIEVFDNDQPSVDSRIVAVM